MSDEPSNCVAVNGVSYCVGHVPMRKRVTLFRHEGTAVTVVATFASGDAAETFRAWLVGLSRLVREGAA